MPRFVVLELSPGQAASDQELHAIATELGTAPAVIVNGWTLPTEISPSAVICVGPVREAADAVAAMLAAVSGARLVVAVADGREVIDPFLDDLRRLGEVEHRVGEHRPRPLSPDQRELLGELLAGSTLADAARRLHLSRRTADRRLAAAKVALGARTTAEALHLAAQRGLQPRPESDREPEGPR